MQWRTLRPRLLFLAAVVLLPAAAPAPAAGQTDPAGDTANSAEEGPGARSARALSAVRVQGAPPSIDGDLSDPAWVHAPVATDFVQVNPREGAPASQPTEARVLYDDHALYIAIRAWDSAPDSIAAQLGRRDQTAGSDRLHVLVDSYFDRRTAFHFAVNPLGVKLDLYRYDDHREDSGWDAVWDVATRIDDEGWTAEFRIPHSQLRFSGAPVQTWGINFGRDIHRLGELSVWSPMSQQEDAVVSRSGQLRDIRDLAPPRRLEVLPYTLAQLERAPGSPDDPFYERNDTGGQVGADVKVGITSGLTLDLTVNPDFGQVEADPAQVNLTAFETFLPERRPFFQEGAGIFRFGIGLGDGDGGNESLFYSRRIGRAPQGRVTGAEWVDRPARTRILAAGKLSGQTEGGWSIGALGALTGAEEARVERGGEFARDPVEPRAGYWVLRLRRDFREGESALGTIGTATYREGSGSETLGLRQSAYAGGVDFRHRFRDGTMEFRGNLLGSHVGGSREALLATQLSSARYFQRPDADHVSLDPEATTMQGWSGTFEFWKMGGGPWRFAAMTQARSPGFEVNDLGFMPTADYLAQVVFAGYFQNRPGRHLRSWQVNSDMWNVWTFGGERIDTGMSLNASATLHSQWSLRAGVAGNPEVLSPILLRGGPAFRTEPQMRGYVGVGTDPRRDLQGNLNVSGNVRPESDSRTLGVSPSIRWHPSQRTTLRIGGSYSRREDDRQWVTRASVAGEPHYLFGRIEQTTTSLNLRADVALTPTLSFQLYAQPFVSAGSFRDFKRVDDPRGGGYADRFEPLDATLDDGTYTAPLDGGGQVTFGNPDFNVKQFRSNAVLRWEYRPGSTLYLVWSQGRDHQAASGDFDFGSDFGDLFRQESENVFMVKMNYWFTP